MTDWLTAAGIAAANGFTPARVLTALALMGLRESKLNSRLEEGGRVYSPAAQLLVVRELTSRDTDIGADLDGGVVSEPEALIKTGELQRDFTVEALRERLANAGALRELTFVFERSRAPAYGATVRLPMVAADGGRRWGPTSKGIAKRVSAGVYEAQWLVSDLRAWMEAKGQS